MKRQSFKLEFTNKMREKYEDKYLLTISGPMMTLKKTNLYRDVEFKEQLTSLNPGTKIVPTEIQYTLSGTPRLVLKYGSVLKANKDFIVQIKSEDHHTDITEIQSSIKL